MKDSIPDYLSQGEQARLFPVLSTTSKEGRTASIFLACMSKIDEFGEVLLESVAKKVGKRTKIQTYTEIVFKNERGSNKDRPDGLIVLKQGNREWRALVEAKIGNSELDADQIERYRNLAKDFDLDCLITISNQFATSPDLHPLEEVRKSKSKIPVFHWSWMYILTLSDILLSQDDVEDVDQKILLNELRRFLTHPSAGLRGFDRMPTEWQALNKLVASGGNIPAKHKVPHEVILAWHQETRDLSLILSRMLGTEVKELLSRKHRNDFAARIKDELDELRGSKQLRSSLDTPDAAATLDVVVDLQRKTVDVGMLLRAPEDKVSSKARLNWLLRQIPSQKTDNLVIRCFWPGRAEETTFPFNQLKQSPDRIDEDRAHLAVHSFLVFNSVYLGARFSQQANFIADLEEIVPAFYHDIGSSLAAWKKRAPKIEEDRASAARVSAEALSEEAQSFEA